MNDWKVEFRRRPAKLKMEPTREAAVIEELAERLEDCYVELRSSGATEAEAYQRTLADAKSDKSRPAGRVARRVRGCLHARRTSRMRAAQIQLPGGKCQ